MSGNALPPWALQRVAAVVEKEQRLGGRAPDVTVVARRSGLSKRLARRCLFVLDAAQAPMGPGHAPTGAHADQAARACTTANSRSRT